MCVVIVAEFACVCVYSCVCLQYTGHSVVISATVPALSVVTYFVILVPDVLSACVRTCAHRCATGSTAECVSVCEATCTEQGEGEEEKQGSGYAVTLNNGIIALAFDANGVYALVCDVESCSVFDVSLGTFVHHTPFARVPFPTVL